MADTASTTVAVVLVHGGFVDGSGWEDVYKILKKDGYNVSIVQNPTLSLADDVAVTEARPREAESAGDSRRPLLWRGRDHRSRQRSQSRGACLYRGFAPDKGESVATLIKDPPPGAPVPPILPPQDGYLFLDTAKFAASFAGDVDKEKAEFMADSQVPWGVEALSGTIKEPAWKTKRELVPGRNRRQDDPSPGAAVHVEARGFYGCRGQGQPRRLCFAVPKRWPRLSKRPPKV